MDRWGRPVAIGLTIAFLLWGIVLGSTIAAGMASRGELGSDATFYAGLGRHFLDTGQAYYPAQLSGPYPPSGQVNLYPPVAMYLFAAFTVLPIALWWSPVALTAWLVWRWRPAHWSWPILAFLLGTVPTLSGLLNGNMALWTTAFVAIGLRRPVAAAFLAIRPTDLVVAPLFALRSSFWLGVVLVLVLSLPFGQLWIDWLRAMLNISGSSLLRNILDVTLLLIPVVAWLARTAEPWNGRTRGD